MQNPARRLDTFSLSDFEYDKSAFVEAEAEWTKRLNFTWYPVDFKESNTLRLQLDWEYPKNVSLRDFKDSVSVSFQNTVMFIEWSQNATLIPNGL